MSEVSGTGMSVLLTRPAHQADTLRDAIVAAGGTAVPYPVMDIVARHASDIERELRGLPHADIVIFVSPNAVRHGLAAISADATIAAIGQATAAALTAAGHDDAVVPPQGFDSEALLNAPALRQVAGQRVRIVRGDGGRELLGKTLTARGAQVDYVSVYRRRPHEPTAAEIAGLEAIWRDNGIDYVIAMSVASLEFLLDVLPASCRQDLPASVLVTPSDRVLKTTQERVPGMRTLLAASPDAGDMVAAMITDRNGQMDNVNE